MFVEIIMSEDKACAVLMAVFLYVLYKATKELN